ncbi:unnamed protein product [Acanthoscelides obtectus]|uniref:TIL domain-containing protein n=1 Tax=Acanthoscelides obtectus TaxID=200917 RepID=A0A9P0KH47_ACAOB|nr:unnamed protein product [Acanthoscelides obtectus]CAK1666722.1 hypothetical protein AOBTE_LOCUS25454 [Acanthoscelides obtectus]
MKYFALSILSLFVILTAYGNASIKCGPNETAPACRPCRTTCADRHKICSFICIHNTKCYCRPGFLRKRSRCVPESKC